MGNQLFEAYQKCCSDMEELINAYSQRICADNEFRRKGNYKKLRGAVTVELLRRELDRYLSEHKKPICTSRANVYIAGSKFEYDLLLVKKDAVACMDLVYRPNDVVAVIECKAGGLFRVDEDTGHIANAFKPAYKLNPHIRFGYITMSENVPKNEYNSSGRPTVKHWKLTNQLLNEKFENMNAIYAVTLHQGSRLYDEGNDQEFEKFVSELIYEA